MKFQTVVLSLLLAISVCSCSGDRGSGSDAGQTPAGPAGFLLITVDGLIASELPTFGGAARTPRLEALGRQGQATLAWTAIPMTRPAVATYLTGLGPDRHGIWDDLHDTLDPALTTLPGRFAEAGYRTAAFPDAARLGYLSGLLGSFEIVDAPPAVQPGIQRWRRLLRSQQEQSANVEAWLTSLAPDDRWFAWVHTSTPLLGQQAPGPVDLSRFDEWLGGLLDAAERHTGPDLNVIVAGTLGDVRGAEGSLPGPGMSVDAAAVTVPLFLRLAGGTEINASGDAWSPDVPATFAAIAGLSLAGEGIDLRSAAPGERTRYSWSAVPRDELGWQPLVAAGVGADGGERPVPVPQAADDELLDTLRARGLKPAPVSTTGRRFGNETQRRQVAALLWNSRIHLQNQAWRQAGESLQQIAALDPDALAGYLDRGQLLTGLGDEAATPALEHAVELYPWQPEAIHWYVHAHWKPEHGESNELLLRRILPLRKGDFDVLYDLACLRSLAGDVEESETFLRSAIEAGYREWEHMQSDSDLRGLRESGRFAEIMQAYHP